MQVNNLYECGEEEEEEEDFFARRAAGWADEVKQISEADKAKKETETVIERVISDAVETSESALTIENLSAGWPKKSFTANCVVAGGKNLACFSAAREKDKNVLWLQPLNGGAPRRIAALGDEKINGKNLPITPDGKALANVQGEWLRDAVLLKGLK